MARETVNVKLQGGGKLEKKLLELAQRLGTGAAVKVGILEGATYPDGTSVAQVGFWDEFGTTKMPARSFMRSTVAAKSGRWPEAMAKAAKATNYDARATMGLMGELIQGQIQHTINTLSSPPLAQSTMDAKGFSKPLIETARLLNSIDYEVIDRSAT